MLGKPWHILAMLNLRYGLNYYFVIIFRGWWCALLFEAFTTGTMLAVLGGSLYAKHGKPTQDNKKIERIADNVGLYVKEGKIKKTIRLHRKTVDKKLACTEYVYQIPLGLEFKDFEEKKGKFIDGLNNLSVHRVSLADFKTIKLDTTVLKQIYNIFNKRIKLNKIIEMEYDGMLLVRVYEQGLQRKYPFTQEILDGCKGWEVPIGYTYKGFIRHDFEKLQILVVAGTTRYGKTVFLKSLITTLIHNKPSDVEFTLVDLKGGLAFNRFAPCKQVKTVASNMQETVEALEHIQTEILRRQTEFKAKGYEDITEASYKKRHFIVIDEGAEIATYGDKKLREQATNLVGEIARIGAGLGFRLVFATQYPTADVFPRQVKANTTGKLCFRLTTDTQSMVVLDKAGAEQLPVKLAGRAIYQTDTEHMVQTPFIENKFIADIITPHININARKEDNSAPPQNVSMGSTGGGYTTFFEET